MKKILFLFLGFCSFALYGQNNAGYIIKGTILGQNDIQKVYLLLQTNENSKNGREFSAIDSANVKNNSFVFKGKVDLPQKAALNLEGRLCYFYIENSAITFSAHVDSIYNGSIEGSKTDVEFRSYNNVQKSFDNQRTILFNEKREAGKAGDKEKTNTIDKQLNDLEKKRGESISEYINSHRSSSVALDAAKYWFLRSIDARQIDSLLNIFDKSLQSLPTYYRAVKLSDNFKRFSPGKPFVDFTANDPNGNALTVSDLAKNKILLIDFWEANCIPCRREHPNMVQLYNKFHSRGFDILSVSSDAQKEIWVEAINKDKMIWNHVNDLKGSGGPLRRLYMVNSTPRNFLLDKNGIIIARNIYGKELEKLLEKLINSN